MAISADLMRNAWFATMPAGLFGPGGRQEEPVPLPRRGPIKQAIEHPELEPVEAIVWNSH
jgi:hypothetical protein